MPTTHIKYQLLLFTHHKPLQLLKALGNPLLEHPNPAPVGHTCLVWVGRARETTKKKKCRRKRRKTSTRSIRHCKKVAQIFKMMCILDTARVLSLVEQRSGRPDPRRLSGGKRKANPKVACTSTYCTQQGPLVNKRRTGYSSVLPTSRDEPEIQTRQYSPTNNPKQILVARLLPVYRSMCDTYSC